jgi:hypothetical protein
MTKAVFWIRIGFLDPNALNIFTDPDPAVSPDPAYSSECYVNKLNIISLTNVYFFPLFTGSIYFLFENFL